MRVDGSRQSNVTDGDCMFCLLGLLNNLVDDMLDGEKMSRYSGIWNYELRFLLMHGCNFRPGNCRSNWSICLNFQYSLFANSDCTSSVVLF